MDVDLFGTPVGETITRVEWAVRWPNRGPLYAKPGYVAPCSGRAHAEQVAAGPAGATWAPGEVVRREVVIITGDWEQV